MIVNVIGEVSETDLKIGQPKIKSMDAWSANEFQWLDFVTVTS